MNTKTLIQTLENRLTALDSKKQVAIDKGSFELFEIFNHEYHETLVTLDLMKNAVAKPDVITVRDALKAGLLENLPSLSFYFRKKSIHTAVSDSMDKAFEQVKVRVV